jgi:hypothetical protein
MDRDIETKTYRPLVKILFYGAPCTTKYGYINGTTITNYMNCLVDSIILYLTRQGKNARAISQYLRDRYRISIDVESVKARRKNLNSAANLT